MFNKKNYIGHYFNQPYHLMDKTGYNCFLQCKIIMKDSKIRIIFKIEIIIYPIKHNCSLVQCFSTKIFRFDCRCRYVYLSSNIIVLYVSFLHNSNYYQHCYLRGELLTLIQLPVYQFSHKQMCIHKQHSTIYWRSHAF